MTDKFVISHIMTKDDRIAVRLDGALKAALVKAAEADGRTLSSMVAKIIADWLKRRPK